MFVIYVNMENVSGPYDGRSWCTAFNNLQSALDIAETNPGIKILVAEGIYIPTKLYSPNDVQGGVVGITTPNMNTFNIPHNTTLVGGFRVNCGCAERNAKKYKSILSGANVSWHVVILGNDVAQTGVSAVIDGFVITQGNAQGPIFNNTIVAPFQYAHSYGAGIYSIFGSNLVLRNSILQMNIANGIGGALFSISSDLLIEKSSVSYSNSSYSICKNHNNY